MAEPEEQVWLGSSRPPAPMGRPCSESMPSGGTDGSRTVAVIVTSYNAERYITETVRSVLAQSFPHWSLVIVDDGSTDGTCAVVELLAREDSRISLIRHPENLGVAAARNTGAKTSESDYLLFLDADDILEPSMLRTTTDHLDRHLDINGVYVRQSYIDDSGAGLGDEVGAWPWARCVATRFGVTMIPDSEPTVPFESIYLVAVMIPSLTLVRRDAFTRSGGWDESFGPICEDTDFYLRLRLDGMIHFLPQVLVRYRRHPTQVTAVAADKFAAQYAKVHQSIADAAGTDSTLVGDAEWFRVHRFIPYRHLTAARDALKQGEMRTVARNLKGAMAGYSPRRPPASLFRS